MKLSTRINNIKLKLSSSLEQIKLALVIKGVTPSEKFSFTDVARHIRLIYQEDFEFVFNFRDIDQFGNPHVPNTGQSIGGMVSITPSMDDIVVPEYAFTTDFVFETITANSGHNIGGADVSITIDDFVVEKLEAFNEPTIPEVLNYDPSFETT